MLYQNEGIYRYKGGVNWRAVATLFVVVPINLPGLMNAIDNNVKIGSFAFFCKLSHCSMTLRSVS
jgi:NCS1 family nucleobase:cation symporter-1